jgi:hypothetical protein
MHQSLHASFARRIARWRNLRTMCGLPQAPLTSHGRVADAHFCGLPARTPLCGCSPPPHGTRIDRLRTNPALQFVALFITHFDWQCFQHRSLPTEKIDPMIKQSPNSSTLAQVLHRQLVRVRIRSLEARRQRQADQSHWDFRAPIRTRTSKWRQTNLT